MAESSLAIDVVSRRNRPVRTETVKNRSMGSAPRQLRIRANLRSCPQPLRPVREMAWTGPAGWLSMTLPQAARRARREALTPGMTAPVLRKSAAGQTAREGSRFPRREGLVVVQAPHGRTRNTSAAPIRFPESTRRPYLVPADRPIGPGKRPTRTVLSWRAMAARLTRTSSLVPALLHVPGGCLAVHGASRTPVAIEAVEALSPWVASRIAQSGGAMSDRPDGDPRFLSSERPQSHQGRSSDVRENRWLTRPERGPVTRWAGRGGQPSGFSTSSKATGRCCGPFASLRRRAFPPPSGPLVHADFDAPRLGRIAAASCHLGFSQLDAFLGNADVLQ